MKTKLTEVEREIWQCVDDLRAAGLDDITIANLLESIGRQSISDESNRQTWDDAQIEAELVSIIIDLHNAGLSVEEIAYQFSIRGIRLVPETCE